jgi:hypothetical protein
MIAVSLRCKRRADKKVTPNPPHDLQDFGMSDIAGLELGYDHVLACLGIRVGGFTPDAARQA